MDFFAIYIVSDHFKVQLEVKKGYLLNLTEVKPLIDLK